MQVQDYSVATIIDGKDLGRALTAVLDGVDSTFAGIQIDKGVSNVVLKNLTIKNCSDGVLSDANGALLSNCTLENNINGVTSYGRIVVDSCKITNNKSDGVLFHHPMGVDSKSDTLFVKNSVIASNGSGISVRVPIAKGSIIENNLIYSNREYGVYLHEGDNYLYKNYIGTNRSFADLGNGNDGVYVYSNASVTLGHESSIDSANFIGFNKGNGIYSEVRLNVYKNYIGVTNLREIIEEIDGVIVNRTRHTAMPNGKNGIEAESGTIKGNYIGYNKQNGIVLQRGNVEENYIGGIIDFGPKYRFGNGSYGLSIENTHWATDVINNHFVDNSKGGIYTADPSYSPGYDDDEIRVTKNLFGGDQDRTIYGTHFNSPIIDTIHYDDDYYKAEYILIKGKVNFSTLPSGVTPDKEKVGIEIYLSLGVNSAYKYVGYTESDKDGNWVYKIPKNMVDPNRYFTATAIHYGLVPTAGNRQVSVNYTSALSAPKWFGYKPTALKYYVKENGKGDGSSWDKAMGPDEFATYLPIVPSGTVFYVAQGMYHPIYNPWGEKNVGPRYKINNNVTIHGGFPKEAKSGAVADPSVYKTFFSGDIQENDKIIESVDENGALIIERPDDLYKDNSGTLFEITGGDYTVNIDGVCIEGSSYGLFAYGEDTKLNVNACEFTNNGNGIFYNYSNNKVSVSNSIFKYHTGYAIESLYGDVDVNKCEFLRNSYRVLFAAGDANISFDSILVHDNSAEIECVGNSKLSISNSEFYDNIYPELIMTYDTSKVTLISKTNFKNNICRSYVIRHHGKKMILDSCLIDNNKASYCVYGTNDFYIYNSSITNNESKSELLYNASGNEFVLKNSLVGNNVTDSYLIGNWGVPSSIINSTIVDNKCSSIVYATSNASYYNNTIVENECSGPVLYDCSTTELIGNILTGNIHGSDALTFYGKDTSAYNIIYPVHRAGYGYDSIKGLDNYFIDDLDKEKALLSYLFDVDGSDKLLIKDNGGFTPTIALKSDVLADDTPIRFPRLENVLTDQRGESRDDMTCMGAYELIEIDTVIVRDTIVLGKTYVFNDKNMTPEKIGIYRDTMLVKKGNKEVVQVLKLYVKPDGSRNYFYVKKVAEGNGTGSSWNNAMSGEDFAFVLPLVGMGVKFYIAEGVYNPIYDAYGDESDDPTSLCYRIKNNVTFYGGYPADAKIGATADPENHPTVFSGDHKGDDKVVKGVDENGRLKLTYSNRGDNSMNLFEAHKCDATFNNIIIDGASTGIISNGDVTRFYGNNVTFRNCDYAVYYTSNKAVIFIDGSKFENISSGCLYTPSGWNTNVTSTVFSGNTGYIAYSASEGMMSFDNVSVTGNNAQIYSVNNVELKISNSEFINNDNSGSLIYVVNKDRETKITKSLFKENKKLILDFDANSSLIIDSCSFIGNTEKLLDIVGSSNTTIGNSIFEKNILPIVDQENEKRENLVSSYGYVDIKSSSFFDNKCGSLVYVTSLDAENNTFVKNDVSSVIYQIYSGDIFRLSNNTIISNRASDYPLYANSSAKAYFYGNVILDNTQDLTQTYRNQYIPGELSEFYNIKEAKFNLMDIIRKNPQTELYDNSTYIPDNNSNIWVKPREITMQEDYDNCGACEYATDKSEEYYLTNLFEGALDSETGRFYPSIKDNGGYTPTVALKSNVLPDGTSITFPRLENVLADQRGELRDDMTCMGAYETTGNDTVFVRDTIVLGKTYVFNEKEITPEKIGVYHDTMVVKKGNKEVAQVLKLYVRPDWLFNCYVKKVAEGTGDGSSWENAMSAEDFAFALPFAAVGAEFYVAEGIYNPIYDASGNETDDPTSLCYRIQNNALIHGGYPADAKTGATPDPENHPTIFSGDHKRDDKVVKGVDENRRLTITYSNREDNSKQLFVSKASVVRLYNVDIEGATSYGISNVRNGNANFEADNSNFRNCDYAVYYPNKDAVVFINKSKFENISSGCLFTPNGWNTNVTSTVFSGNTGYIAYSASEGMMSFDSVTVTGNNAQIYSVNNVELKISNSEFINNDNSGSLIYMVNADRETTPITKSLFKDNKNQIFEFNANTSLAIDSCSFVGNTNRILYAASGSKTSIGRCVFEKNILPTIDDKKSDLVFSYGNVDVKSSSYFDNECGNLVSVTSVDVENSTFVKNDVSSIIYQSNSGDIFRLSNNTIISNRASSYPLHSNSSAKAYFYGNVILDNKEDDTESSKDKYSTVELSEFYNIQEVKFNLMDIIRKNPQTETYDMSTYIPDDNTNIFVKPREITVDEIYSNCKACEFASDKSEEYYLTNLFEGSLDSETGTFSPTIQNNGGSTPTVALKNNVLPDGTSITFPRLENVLTDQRGVSRFDETCMGAYEMRCGSDTTFTTDTIYVGEKIYGQTFTKVGVHDSIFETLTSSLDCDSVVMHRVVVKPDPKTFNYYVKMKKAGDGDGRDWDNAMDSTDFATYLPLAPDGATFYVAAGTYKPKYGIDLQISAMKSGMMYEINSNVTIIGGFPADATGKDVPSEPKKYHTVFDGDIVGDDEITETSDGDYLSVSVANRKDNSSYMFFSKSNKEIHVAFDGISVKSSGGAVYILNPDKYVKISNSEFTYNNNAVYMPYEEENLEVYNSKFSKNFSNVIYMPTASNLTMDSILFENNQRNLVNIPGPSGVNPNHNVRLNRIYAYANGDSSAIVYSIGHDFVLSNSEFKNNRGLLYLYDNTRIDSTLFENNYGDFTKYGVLGFEINECSFVDNKCKGTFIYTAKNGTEYNHFSLTNSTFKNTDSKGLMYVVTDSVNISKSEISGSTNSSVDLNNYRKAVVNNCYIHDNEHLYMHYNGYGSNTFTYLKENTIANNINVGSGLGYLLDFTSNADSVVFTNNTFVSNSDGNLINFTGCRPYMYNNTIVGNVNESYLISSHPGNLVLKGNIILGNNSEIVGTRWSNIDYKNNILPRIVYSGDASLSTIDQEILDNNIFSIFDNTGKIHEELKDIPNRNEEILTYLFEGKYNSETGLFTPVLADNGGFTPTVALKSDKLSDGKSIRFPRLENVLTDQRGVSRLDETCMGAYELGCGSDTTFTTDTINVGDKILG
ncbi:MAG: right-handed parallel beta-helix repeat-containing protein, partial [Paludibacteraceae bacterium]|nr:right-handed parallel beta-helix repeat-containing protein [Paludibacteraceae bacterium]